MDKEIEEYKKEVERYKKSMTTKDILLEISDNIASIDTFSGLNEIDGALTELAYQNQRIADALHHIKDAMFDIFTYGKGYENETIAEIVDKLSNSIKENGE